MKSAEYLSLILSLLLACFLPACGDTTCADLDAEECEANDGCITLLGDQVDFGGSCVRPGFAGCASRRETRTSDQPQVAYIDNDSCWILYFLPLPSRWKLAEHPADPCRGMMGIVLPVCPIAGIDE